ncbi:MAG: PGPGW domain-containing protein [Gammaproteobacteria bacterium]|jgi:tellurite resistance protein TerC
MIQNAIALSLRSARRLFVIVAGTTVLLLGAAFLVLPGPGLLIIPLGLAILAIEFLWARDLLHKLRRGLSEASRRGRIRTRQG